MSNHRGTFWSRHLRVAGGTPPFRAQVTQPAAVGGNGCPARVELVTQQISSDSGSDNEGHAPHHRRLQRWSAESSSIWNSQGKRLNSDSSTFHTPSNRLCSRRRLVTSPVSSPAAARNDFAAPTSRARLIFIGGSRSSRNSPYPQRAGKPNKTTSLNSRTTANSANTPSSWKRHNLVSGLRVGFGVSRQHRAIFNVHPHERTTWALDKQGQGHAHLAQVRMA